MAIGMCWMGQGEGHHHFILFSQTVLAEIYHSPSPPIVTQNINFKSVVTYTCRSGFCYRQCSFVFTVYMNSQMPFKRREVKGFGALPSHSSIWVLGTGQCSAPSLQGRFFCTKQSCARATLSTLSLLPSSCSFWSYLWGGMILVWWVAF